MTTGPANLARSQIRETFQVAYATSPFMELLDAICVRVRGETPNDVSGLVGPVTSLKRKSGQAERKPPITARVSWRNDRYHGIEPINIDDYRRDQTGQLRNRVSAMGVKAAILPMQLIADMVKANTDTAYDGTALVSSSRSFAASGTQRNDLTSTQIGALNVGSAGATTSPTPEQVADIISAVEAYQYNLVDWNGDPMLDMVSGIDIICPPNLRPSFRTALFANNLSGGETNTVMGLTKDGTQIRLWTPPRFFASPSSSAFFYVCVRSASSNARPFILSEEVPAGVDFIGEGSEHAQINDEVVVKGSWVGGVAVGEPMLFQKHTLSAS
jgi:hypothetical protein